MKKLLILVGLLGIIVASTATAAQKPSTSLRLEDGSAVNIYAKDLGVKMVRVVDGKYTCYIVSTENAVNIQSSASISCVK